MNQQSNYPAGVLFALIAKAYLEYAELGAISNTLLERIYRYIDRLKVYGFLKLPITLITDDKDEIESIQKDFNWIDFDYTLNEYKKFIKQLRG